MNEVQAWPPILGIRKSILATLAYLRRNRVQAEIVESFGVSQSTISRAVSIMTPVLGQVLAEFVPRAEDLDPRQQYIVDGRCHDSAALAVSGMLDGADAANWMGDKGYLGAGMITPFKKPLHRELLDWEKEFDTAVNQIRYVIERAIAHVKTWRILHTDYRRPLSTFRDTITTMVALHFYKLA